MPLTTFSTAPCMTAVLARLLPLTAETGPDDQIEELLGADPGLCLQLLNLLGDAHPAGRMTVASLLQASGRTQLHSLVLAAALDTRRPGSQVISQQAWRASMQRALASRALARVTGYPSPEEAYLAGLLLSCGQLLQASQLQCDHSGHAPGSAPPPDCEPCRQAAAQAQLSATLLQGSRLSPVAIDALRYRDLAIGALCDAHPLTRLLLLAERLGNDPRGEQTAEAAALWLSLSSATLAGIDSETLGELHLRQLQLGLPQTPSDADLDTSDTELQDALWVEAAFAGQVRALESTWALLRSSLLLRFGLRSSLLLRHQTACQTLEALESEGSAASDLSLRCEAGSSLAADALRLGAPQSSFEHGGNRVADQQIARLLGKDGLLCLPCTAGVVVLGLDQEELLALRPRLPAVQGLVAAATRTLPASAQGTPSDALLERIREVQHEIATPLTTLNSYLHLMAGKSPDSIEALRIMRDELARIGSIVRSMGGPSATVPRSRINLNLLLGDLLAGFRLTLAGPQGIEIRTDFAANLPALESDTVALKQIFTNLIQNALEAMPEGGRLNIRSSLSADSQQLSVTIADTGGGIEPAVMARLYEPKVSSKPGHSGLGLSIIKPLIERLGGDIQCQSLPGVGSRFQVHLPLHTAPVQHPKE